MRLTTRTYLSYSARGRAFAGFTRGARVRVELASHARRAAALPTSLRGDGGRWSDEAVSVLLLLAKAKARTAPKLLERQLASVLHSRWSAMVAVTAQTAVSETLAGGPYTNLGYRAESLPAWGELD